MTVTLETQFSETAQSEPWKNAVAIELNILLRLAGAPVCSGTYRHALLSIVGRVAESEEITALKGEE